MAGDGTLYQKKNNSKWYWIYNTGEKVVNKKGKEVYEQKWIDLETTDKKQAIENRKAILADIVKKGRYDPPTTQTVNEWLDFWLNEVAKPEITDNTYDFYEYIIRVHLKPELGPYQLKRLQPETIQTFLNGKRKERCLKRVKNEKKEWVLVPGDRPLSTRTLKGAEIVLSMALASAVGMRKIPDNPMTGVSRVKYKRAEVKYMTSEEVVDFLEKIRGDRWYYAFVVVLGTGMRIGEFVALKWSKINLSKKVIMVENAIAEVNTYLKAGPKTKKVTKKPKSEKGIREIPLPDDAVVALKKQREMQIQDRWTWEQKRIKDKEWADKHPTWKPKRKHERPAFFESDYAFTMQDGRPVNANFISKYFLKLTRKHGFEGLTFHKQRHSYASMLLENGEDMKTIQDNLGDASLKLVSDTYTHVAEKLKRQAATKLSGFTKRKKGVEGIQKTRLQ
jgi:integrase